jgi:cytochrome b subunit of formate dehydrogenase
MTMLWRRRRWIFQAGVFVLFSLLPLSAPGSGQTQERGADQRCLNCHDQKHITALSPEEREMMVVAPEGGFPERKNRESLFVEQSILAQGFHRNVACEQCHAGVESLPHSARLPEPQCETCHQQEVSEVSRSRHAKVIRTSEPMPPRCWDCHGAHEIRLQSKVSPQEKIRVCASCHQKYSGHMAGLASGGVLVKSYLDSVHGRRKPGSAEVGATCEDCHGHHEILPVTDPRSKVNRVNIPETCGRCHAEVLKEFESTVHAEVERRHDLSVRAALCNDCHTAHAITHTDTPEFMLDIVSECGVCHKELYRTYRETYHGQVQQLGSVRVARCSDCHGTHNIRRPTDPKSLLSAANRAATCSRCHQEIKTMSASGRENFVAYHPHADFRDGHKNRALFLIWRFTLIISAVLLAIWALHWLGWLNRDWRKRQATPEESPVYAVLRFKPLHRWTHLLATACVVGLTLTGLPLKFNRQPWIVSSMALFGGPDGVALLHRLFAIFLVGIGLFYGWYVLFLRGDRKQPLRKRISGPDSLLPTMRDAQQFVGMFRWFAGRGPRPELDRWSYREKFDYWALVISVIAIAISGTFLWFPAFFARFLSGYWFNVAMVMHSFAGLMALGCTLMIHLFNTSLRKEGFPVNDVMFTGQLSEQELQDERAAQYARLTNEDTLSRLKVQPASDRQRRIAFYVTVASQALGLAIFILIVIATLA